MKVKTKSKSSKKVSDELLESLVPDHKKLDSRIFDLVIGRMLKRVYMGLTEEEKESMGNIFASGDDKSKEDFIKKYIPKFEKVFKAEADKVGEEIKAEIVKQF